MHFNNSLKFDHYLNVNTCTFTYIGMLEQEHSFYKDQCPLEEPVHMYVCMHVCMSLVPVIYFLTRISKGLFRPIDNQYLHTGPFFNVKPDFISPGTLSFERSAARFFRRIIGKL
jgi:hypothetical protein